MNAKFGSSNDDQKAFTLNNNEIFKGIYGAIRRLGKDTRITEIGFWISSTRPIMNNNSNP